MKPFVRPLPLVEPPRPELAEGTAEVNDMLLWPDNLQTRTRVLALLESLNTELLTQDSATLTLERWCVARDLPRFSTVRAYRVDVAEKPLPADLRVHFNITSDTPVRYRRVRLVFGSYVLSEAENWYLPDRLSDTMNHQLEHSDVPFGKVVQSLDYRRKTLSSQFLWSPLDARVEMQQTPRPTTHHRLVIPRKLMRHRALLCDVNNTPFSVLIETYMSPVLGCQSGSIRHIES